MLAIKFLACPLELKIPPYNNMVVTTRCSCGDTPRHLIKSNQALNSIQGSMPLLSSSNVGTKNIPQAINTEELK